MAGNDSLFGLEYLLKGGALYRQRPLLRKKFATEVIRPVARWRLVPYEFQARDVILKAGDVSLDYRLEAGVPCLNLSLNRCNFGLHGILDLLVEILCHRFTDGTDQHRLCSELPERRRDYG